MKKAKAGQRLRHSCSLAEFDGRGSTGVSPIL